MDIELDDSDSADGHEVAPASWTQSSHSAGYREVNIAPPQSLRQLVESPSLSFNPRNASDQAHQHRVAYSSAPAATPSSSGPRYHYPPALKFRGIQTKPASTALTLEQKFRCCQLHDSGVPLRNLCMQFNQSKAVVSNVINNKPNIMSEWFRFSNPYMKKKQRTLKSPAYAEINSAVLKWYWSLKAIGKSSTGVGIQAKAKEVAEQLGYHSFKASNGMFTTDTAM